MKICVLTSSRPRHFALIDELRLIGAEVCGVIEVVTSFPGEKAGFFRQSEAMASYFRQVERAQAEIFGSTKIIPPGKFLVTQMGDLNNLNSKDFDRLLEADFFVVFGSSIVKGWLLQALVERRALNIHIGLSPYYRGSSCNFWALFDENPEFVGATVHELTAGLDSGPIAFHVIPAFSGEDPFCFTMKSVRSVQKVLAEKFSEGSLETLPRTAQNKNLQIRYTRGGEFTDEVAQSFLARGLTAVHLENLLRDRVPPKDLVHPVVR